MINEIWHSQERTLDENVRKDPPGVKSCNVRFFIYLLVNKYFINSFKQLKYAL